MSTRELLPHLQRNLANTERKNLWNKEWKDFYRQRGRKLRETQKEFGIGFGTQTMLGSVVLLLSLLVLSTGSDARRIRKRGLNHKVGLQTSSLRLFMGAWLSPIYLMADRRIVLKWKKAHSIAVQ